MDPLILQHDGDGWAYRESKTLAAEGHRITVDSDGSVSVEGDLHSLAVGSDGVIWGRCLRPFAEGNADQLHPLLQLPDLPGAAVDLGPIGVCSRRVVAFEGVGDVQTVRVTNLGLAPLAVDRIELAGACADDFVIIGESFTGVQIHPGSYCEVALRFEPRAAGPRSAELTFCSNAANRRETVTLEGCGPLESAHRFTWQAPCQVALPVTLEATGQCGLAEVSAAQVCGTVHEFVVMIPFLVQIAVDVDGHRCETERLVMAKGQLCLELPQEGDVQFTLIQKLQVEVPLALEAEVDADMEVTGEWRDLL